MKIEFLKNGSPDCPLIRIFGNQPFSFTKLALAFRQLANNQAHEIAIHEIPGFQTIEGCLLVAKQNSDDLGVRSLDNGAFECLLKSQTWERLAELVDPFTEQFEGVRFQWLDETPGISLLISSSELGEW